MLGQTEWAKMVLVERYQEADNARLARQVKRANKAAKTLSSNRRRSLRRLRELPTRN
ncbi:MAG TPA: hypothetical protein VFP67_14810 [Acidimicrobiia bacterium]|nr:hypothetical protein [Acidimicrobiia bacterium]